MNWQPYPKYKESGVQWLGEVPEHWEVKRLKRIVRNIDKKVETDEDNPLQYVGLENIESWYGKLIDLNADTIPSGIANHFSSKNTLFGKLRPYLAKACNPDFDGLCSTELIVLEPVELIRRVLLFCLLADGFIKLVNSSAYGTKMPRSNWGFIGNCLLPLPPKEEQTAIADFLDRETGRIDTLVAKNKKLIELLKEERSALISRTVTRGLPEDAAIEYGLEPHTRFKESGVEWLGEVPDTWVVSRIKYVCRLYGRIGFRGYSIDDLVFEGEGAISMSPSNMVEGKVDLSKATWLSWEKYYESPEIMIEANDVVMVKTGSTFGKTSFVDVTEIPMTINPQLMIFKKINCEKKYLFYFISSKVIQDLIPLLNTGSTIPTMTQDSVGRLYIPKPSRDEQTVIANYLDRETAKIDKLIEKIQMLVTRLQEYRIAIITDAVTGKIDVREMAA